jgi:hypothetical protein
MREAQIERNFPIWKKIAVIFALTFFINTFSLFLSWLFGLSEHAARLLAALTFVVSLSFGFVVWLALRPAKAEKSRLQIRPWSGRFDAWKPPMDDARRVEKE